MRINEYYRDAANLNLNGSIAALFPVMLLIAGNIAFFRQQEILVLAIPFLVYSFYAFQLSLFQWKQSIMIKRNMTQAVMRKHPATLIEVSHLIVLYNPGKLQFYFPNGYLAGYIKRTKDMFTLYNPHDEAIGIYKICGKRIEAYNQNARYLGCLEIRRQSWRKKNRGILSASGKFMGSVEGSTTFMDEKIFNQHRLLAARLRRGWMPVEWSTFFPEPNTPVLSFNGTSSHQDKLLHLSLLVQEFFIER